MAVNVITLIKFGAILLGDCSGLSKELSPSLDIVGRISPDTVWEYIGKMRSSNSKVISLIRLNATNIEEQMPYLALYSYLSSRNRLGVVKSTNKSIKDFYILPLAAQKPIPQALLPISGPGMENCLKYNSVPLGRKRAKISFIVQLALLTCLLSSNNINFKQ